MAEDTHRIYWDDRLRRHWGPEGAGSVVYGRRFNLWRYRVREKVFRRVIRRTALPPEGISVLDVGMGTGFYLDQWRRLGVRSLSGLDISDCAVERTAQADPGGKYYRSDIGAVSSPLPVEGFDAVSAIDVLVHIVDDAAYLRALAHIHNALKPGGWLFYSDAFFHGPEKRFEDYWKGRTLSTASTALQTCGFEIVFRVPMSVLMSAPTDTLHRERNEALWEKVLAPVRRSERIGFWMGALLYPFELLLVSILRESPAIELMVCRKW
jgi:SAM-dependent methyltransferase